jgi:hypothetical protein
MKKRILANLKRSITEIEKQDPELGALLKDKLRVMRYSVGICF